MTKNHREEEGAVAGDARKKSKIWVLEVNTLEELIKLTENTEIVVGETNHYKEITHEIEMYDGYRE